MDGKGGLDARRPLSRSAYFMELALIAGSTWGV